MEKKEIYKFCIEKGFLLDKDLLDIFNEEEDLNLIKNLILCLKETTNERILNKSLFLSNKENVLARLSKRLKETEYNHLITFLNKDNQKDNQYIIKDNSSSKDIPLKNEESSKGFKGDEDIQISFSYALPTKRLEVSNFVNYFKNRLFETKKILQEDSHLKNLISINKLSFNKQSFSIIGLVYSKFITKNKNILFEVEDLTGKIKILITPQNKDLYQQAEEISLDSVMGFSGFGNKEMLFVNNILFPDTFLNDKKKSDKEQYAVFIGDIHFGSKLFLEKSFLRFIDYLNNKLPNTPEVPNIKYLFIVGDLVAGIGNYPTQEKDLKIKDIEEQFTGLSNLLSKIRKDIKIIISPGNHDGVRLMEPQPPLNEKYSWSIYNLKNVFLTGNPSYLNVGRSQSFPGFNVLVYHGFSFPYYANTVPSLIHQDALNAPTKIMAYLLKNRHLAPTHSSVQYFPSEEDFLLLRQVPDLFVSGHTHKCEISYYNNILLISVASWESKTSYQEKMGNNPDFCKVPLFNLKTRSIKLLDFEEDDLKSNE